MTWELIKEALMTLRTNLLRTILTMVGIILGVSAVVAIMTLGRSAFVTVEEEINGSGFGKIQITQNYNVAGDSLPLNQSTINILNNAKIEGILSYDSNFYGFSGEGRNIYDDSLTVMATYNRPKLMEKQELLAGDIFSDADVESKSLVAVIDDYTAKKLFDSPAASIGQTLYVDGRHFYRIVGVVKSTSMYKQEIGQIFIPMSLGELEPGFQNYGYNFISVDTITGVDYEAISKKIEETLMEAYGFTKADEMIYKVENVKEMMAQVSMFMTAFSIGLSLIAAISLLVGGVGIMNIMLVNVTERTKEIGLMKALGARDKDITFQFLVESIVLTVCGGLIGVVIGISFSYLAIWLANTFAGDMFPKFTFAMDQKSIWVSLIVSILIGLIFGAYPAKKAAKLDPVDALRRD